MIIFGLTGSIGSGKTLSAQYFKLLKAAVFNADKVVHQLYDSDTKIIALAKAYFPDSVINGKINRLALSSHFFSYTQSWIQFQSVVHSIVLEKQRKFIIQSRRQQFQYVVLDVPLLIEANFYQDCNFIINVDVNQLIQKQRIKKRNMSEEKFQFMLKLQLTRLQRIKFSDFIIKSGLDKKSIYIQIKHIIKQVSKSQQNHYVDNFYPQL